MSSKPWDVLTRDEARALIAEHKIVALEQRTETNVFGKPYVDASRLILRLGNGRVLEREDGGDYWEEEWMLMHEVVEAVAVPFACEDLRAGPEASGSGA